MSKYKMMNIRFQKHNIIKMTLISMTATIITIIIIFLIICIKKCFSGDDM